MGGDRPRSGSSCNASARISTRWRGRCTSEAVQVPAGTLEAVERVADLVADLLTGEGLG